MNRARLLLDRLRTLRQRGSLPRSACGAELLRLLQPLLDTGVIADGRSAGGRRLAVCQPAALDEFIAQHYPDAATFPDAPSRVAALASFRDTKALPNDLPEIVLSRVFDAGVLPLHRGRFDAAAATQSHGVFAFVLGGTQDYRLAGPCALVENPTVFLHFERLQLPVGLVIYGHGRISQRLIDWFAAQSAPEFALLHLPDYDPVGLNEFERLRQHLGDRAHLHLPLDLEGRFARLAQPALLQKPHSQALLARLRQSPHPETTRVVALIDRFNAGLEQESLLL